MAQAASGRLEFRVRADVKERIEYAAQLADQPVGDFVRSAAEERADTVIREQSATIVPAEFFDALLDALDNSPSPNPAMARGARRARQVVRHG